MYKWTVIVLIHISPNIFLKKCSFPVLLDYQDWPNKRRKRQNSATASASAAAIPEESCQRSASITSIDEETMHLLQTKDILYPRNYLILGDIIGEGKMYIFEIFSLALMFMRHRCYFCMQSFYKCFLKLNMNAIYF